MELKEISKQTKNIIAPQALIKINPTKIYNDFEDANFKERYT